VRRVRHAVVVPPAGGEGAGTVAGRRPASARADPDARPVRPVGRPYRGGYYEWPRDATAEDVAAGLGIASPTLHRHLRTAHRKLAAAEFEEDTAG